MRDRRVVALVRRAAVVSRARAWLADMAMIALALIVLLILCITVAPILLWRLAKGLRA